MRFMFLTNYIQKHEKAIPYKDCIENTKKEESNEQ